MDKIKDLENRLGLLKQNLKVDIKNIIALRALQKMEEEFNLDIPEKESKDTEKLIQKKKMDYMQIAALMELLEKSLELKKEQGKLTEEDKEILKEQNKVLPMIKQFLEL